MPSPQKRKRKHLTNRKFPRKNSMEQPPTYAWWCGSSPCRDYTYNKSTSNAEEEEEPYSNYRYKACMNSTFHCLYLICKALYNSWLIIGDMSQMWNVFYVNFTLIFYKVTVRFKVSINWTFNFFSEVVIVDLYTKEEAVTVYDTLQNAVPLPQEFPYFGKPQSQLRVRTISTFVSQDALIILCYTARSSNIYRYFFHM